jgi:hypothetical protein
MVIRKIIKKIIKILRINFFIKLFLIVIPNINIKLIFQKTRNPSHLLKRDELNFCEMGSCITLSTQT